MKQTTVFPFIPNRIVIFECLAGYGVCMSDEPSTVFFFFLSFPSFVAQENLGMEKGQRGRGREKYYTVAEDQKNTKQKIKTLKMSDQRADSSLAWRRHCGRVSSKARE